MTELRILGKGGDMKISWNRSNSKEVKAAKDIFEKKIIEGWSAFEDKHEYRGEKVKCFDECADRILLVPPLSGG